MGLPLPDEQLTPMVPELRKLFLQNLEKKEYDGRDVERFKTDDKWLLCFLRPTYDGGPSLTKSEELVANVLNFRKEMKINDLQLESFPESILSKKPMLWHGKDKKGHEILHFNIKSHKRGEEVELAKQYIAFCLDKFQKEKTGEKIVLLFDFTGAGISNMDLEVTKFILSCLTTYFPSILAYLLLFEMPVLLTAVWKIIKSWLSEQQTKYVLHVNKSSIQEHIAPEQLLDHMIK